MELWIKVFEVILPVIIVILTGFCFGKVTNVNLKPVNLLLLYISTPCLIFSSLMDGKITMDAAYQIIVAGSIMVFVGKKGLKTWQIVPRRPLLAKRIDPEI
mgnify:CR=1 FL=1